MRAGAGLVTVATAKSALPNVAGFAAELMTEPLPETDTGGIGVASVKNGKLQQLASTMTVVAIGPGIGRHPETVEFVREAVRTLKCPLVIDADGLNAFDGKTELLDGSKRALVLTPHPGEMSRLAGISTKAVQADRLNVARTFAREHKLVLVLKGSLTIIALPDGTAWVNPTGNPGMATGGTGDILTGMTAGILAQMPDDAARAAVAAVYLHGLAGDVAAETMGEHSLVATDLLTGIAGGVSAGDDVGRGERGAHQRMSTTEYITHSAEETIALGRELAPKLRELRMVILRGDLGAGKTTLVKGIAEGLEAASQDDVTSPTFTLIHEYRGPEVTLYHVDLYRIETERELATLGLDELFAEEGNLVLLEWGEKFPRLVAECDAEITD